MSPHPKRCYGADYLHFITTSCYQRQAVLATAHCCDLFLEILEQVRRRYHFVVVGYVIMPEHVHLLLSEPERGNPSTVMQVLKQRFARKLLRAWRAPGAGTQNGFWNGRLGETHVWQCRFYDFVVSNRKKRIEKLRYMHHNPVKRGLVLEPGQWKWSSFRHYAYDEPGAVQVNEPIPATLKIRSLKAG
jgi:putative transposase